MKLSILRALFLAQYEASADKRLPPLVHGLGDARLLLSNQSRVRVSGEDTAKLGINTSSTGSEKKSVMRSDSNKFQKPVMTGHGGCTSSSTQNSARCRSELNQRSDSLEFGCLPCINGVSSLHVTSRVPTTTSLLKLICNILEAEVGLLFAWGWH